MINTPQISGCIPPEKDPKKDKKPEGEKETSLQYYLKVTGLIVVGVVVIFGIYYYGPAIAALFSSFTGGAKPQQRTHEEELQDAELRKKQAAEMDALRKQSEMEERRKKEAEMDTLRKQSEMEERRKKGAEMDALRKQSEVDALRKQPAKIEFEELLKKV